MCLSLICFPNYISNCSHNIFADYVVRELSVFVDFDKIQDNRLVDVLEYAGDSEYIHHT